MLLSAVVIQLVVNPLQYKMIKVDEIINIEDDGLKAAYLVYIIFFALEHAISLFTHVFEQLQLLLLV